VAEPREYCLIVLSALRAARVPAQLGLVNSTANLRLNPSVPWMGFFDRWVVVAPGRGGQVVFDPLSPAVLGRAPRADCQGRPMMLARQSLDPSGLHSRVTSEFVTAPRAEAGVNVLERTVQLTLGSDGRTQYRLRDAMSGETAYEVADRVADRGIDAVNRESAIALGAAIADLEPATVHVEWNPPASATIEASGETAALLWSAPGGFALHLAPLTGWDELAQLSAPPPTDRRHGIDLGYARERRTTVRVELPPAVHPILPAAASVSGPGLAYSRSFRPTERGFECSTLITVSDPEVPVARLAELGVFLAGVALAESQAVGLDGLTPAASR
jgi:hypothetical protein